MSLLCVFAATEMEGQSVRQIAGRNKLELVIGGMGPRNAKAKAESVLAGTLRPDAIAVIGLCGGLSPSLSEGSIVAYTDCISTEATQPRLQCSRNITNAMTAALRSSKIACDQVVGITSPRVATTKEDRLNLAKSGANVVDMESYSIARVAAAAKIPFVVLRVVSDSIDRKLPDLNRALDPSGALDGRKALRVALGSPVKTVKLLAANKRAMQRLAPALAVALDAEV
jgi:adenosylhomocysteine nucleosidase